MYFKKLFFGFLSLVLILNFISCSNHYHTYESEWSFDEDYHWHKADCEHSDRIIDKQAHFWDLIEVTKEASETEAGEIEIGCSVCNVSVVTQKIPSSFVYVADMKLLAESTELTYAKWNEVYSWAVKNGYEFKNKGQNGSFSDTDAVSGFESKYPVTCVSWRDAIVWCNAASEYEGLIPVYWMENTKRFNKNTESFVKTADESADKSVLNPIADGYRLPTVAEWEKLAKANESFVYSGSNDIEEVAWYKENSSHKTNIVGQKKANLYGMKDMCGNVMELCQNLSITGKVMFRGGSWLSEKENCSIESKNSGSSSYGNNALGFRVVKNIVVTEKDK